MKFSQKHEQIQRQSDTRRLLDSFEASMDNLLLNRPEAVSFQLAYDDVFKLTKLGRQADILNILDEKLAALLRGKLLSQKKQSLPFLHALLVEVRQVAQRMTEICLFFDLNYCQKVMHIPLSKRLASNIFRTFTGDTKALGLLAKTTFEARNNSSPQFETFLQLIDEIDEKQQFFEQHLIPHYIPLISDHYKKQACEAWSQGQLPDYIKWCVFVLSEEESFIDKIHTKKKKRESVDAVVACIYQAIVGEYKSKIYQADENELFQRLTLPILDLLRFGKGKEVEGHIQWFMGALERRLNQIPVDNNTQFIDSFCELYNKVSELLKGTQSKFEINYRSVFAFEEWINNERFNIPLRLNVYIDEFFRLAQREQSGQFFKKTILVFKLVKEKNIFENMYRRTLINRLVSRYLDYNLEQERKLIGGMGQECGEEWSQKIKSICDLYLKDRTQLMKYRSSGRLHHQADRRELIPLVIKEDDWPFESRKSKIRIHPELLKLASDYQKHYVSEGKQNKLSWSTNAGIVTLQITFKETKRLFRASVNMANLLLYIEKEPKKLSHFLSEFCYAMDEIEQSLQTLINKKVIVSEMQGNDYRLKILDSFEEGGLVQLAQDVQGRKLEVRVMEELKADRKLMVEAMIVKIMKGEKMLRRSQLMQKSAPLVEQRGFKFNAQFVEKSIDRLIEKQFIRDFEDGNLGYIA